MSAIIQSGSHVKVHYTGTLQNGTQFDTSEGDAPLEVTLGEGNLIKGFEDNLMGMKQDEEKTFTLAPEDAYGPKNKDLVQTVPRDKFPKNVEPKVGLVLTLRSPQGPPMQAKIAAVATDAITLDLNHPLAGESLTFKIKVVAVE